MKKINLKGISEILSEKELKNVMGSSGSSDYCIRCSNWNYTFQTSASYNEALSFFAYECEAGGFFYAC